RAARFRNFPLSNLGQAYGSPRTADATASRLRVDFRAGLRELCCLLFQSFFDRCFFTDALLRSKFSYVFGYPHGTEMRTAHGTEVCGLRAFARQRLVVKVAGRFGIECEVELIFPSELKPCFRDGVVAVLRAGMALS